RDARLADDPAERLGAEQRLALVPRVEPRHQRPLQLLVAALPETLRLRVSGEQRAIAVECAGIVYAPGRRGGGPLRGQVREARPLRPALRRDEHLRRVAVERA